MTILFLNKKNNMSRSRRKPYIKDSTRCNKYWKRQATRALRHAREAISGMFYKKLFCGCTWCDYRWYDTDYKKAYRK